MKKEIFLTVAFYVFLISVIMLYSIDSNAESRYYIEEEASVREKVEHEEAVENRRYYIDENIETEELDYTVHGDGIEYIVLEGDHLVTLAMKFYDDKYAWSAIMEATNNKAKNDKSFAVINHVDDINPGKKLWIPSAKDIEHFMAKAHISGGVSRHGKESVHWGYEGDTGPERWGKIYDKFVKCEEGRRQSPIDITTLSLEKLEDFQLYYEPTQLTILNNGHTVQVNYDDGSFIKVNGVQYALIQLHFHTPSEHTFNNQHFPMEMHLVHESIDGSFAVIGVMFVEGRKNKMLAQIWEHLPEAERPKRTLDLMVNAADLLPEQRNMFRYRGSLTTPPCTEGISWFVMAAPVEVSIGQIKAFRRIFKFNNRPVQDINDRRVVVDFP